MAKGTPDYSSANLGTTPPTGTAPGVRGAAADTRSPQSAADKAENTAQKAKSKVLNAADAAIDQADNLADDAIAAGRARADALVEQGRSTTEHVIRSVSRAIEAGSQSLQDDGMSATAGYVRAAANGLRSAADEVDGFETGSITGRVENFVRSQPMVTVGALALVGFALAGALNVRKR